MEHDADDEVPVLLLTLNEVFIYKVPPLSSNNGYFAADWGDLSAPKLVSVLRKMYGEKNHRTDARASRRTNRLAR